ncbi:MAG: nuclear transport factor 2 family protein [Polyangiales bacterium]
MIWSRTIALACSLVCCSTEPRPAPAPKPAEPVAPSKPVADPPPPPAAVASPRLERAAAEVLVTRWSRAQNTRDFAAYASLYATRFTGIKRVGDKTTRYDRDSWLIDRERMFERGFTLEVSDVTVDSLGASAVVAFEQVFRTPSFSDRGPKQLVIVLEDGQPKIAREELVHSELAPQLSAATITDQDFAFIRTIGERRFWVSRLSTHGQTIDGAPAFVGVGAAWGAVSSERLPKPLVELRGSSVVIDPTPDGGCEIQLGEVGVLADFHPHFGDVDRWKDGAPEVVAREVFGDNTVDGRHYRYAVEITDAAKGCKTARWARAKGLPPVPVAAVSAVQGADLALQRAAARKTPAYVQLQKAFRAEPKQPKGDWDVVTETVVKGFATQLGTTQLGLLTLSHVADCDAFAGELTVVGRLENGAFKPLATNVQGIFTPQLAIDLDNDGMPEWLSETELLGWDGKTYTPVVSVTPPDYDCGC